MADIHNNRKDIKNSYRLAWKICLMGSSYYSTQYSKKETPRIQALIDTLGINFDYYNLTEKEKHDNRNRILNYILYALDIKYDRGKVVHSFLLAVNLLMNSVMIREGRASFDTILNSLQILDLPTEFSHGIDNMQKEYSVLLESGATNTQLDELADRLLKLANEISSSGTPS